MTKDKILDIRLSDEERLIVREFMLNIIQSLQQDTCPDSDTGFLVDSGLVEEDRRKWN